MQTLKSFMNEHLDSKVNCNVVEGEESIKDEKSFRDYAENKFKEVFGDDLDEDQMKKTIDGIIDDSKDEIEDGDWGAVVGKLNKSFGK